MDEIISFLEETAGHDLMVRPPAFNLFYVCGGHLMYGRHPVSDIDMYGPHLTIESQVLRKDKSVASCHTVAFREDDVGRCAWYSKLIKLFQGTSTYTRRPPAARA